MSGEVGIPRARAKYETARKTRVLHLNNHTLSLIPQGVWTLGAALVRLDLGFNTLRSIPAEIASLTCLEQLWLNDNPFLTTISSEIERCKKLKILDLRRTAIETVPTEIGTLKNLVSISFEGTPFAQKAFITSDVTDTQTLMAKLENVNRRESLRSTLIEKVSNGVYREVADTPEGQRLIPALVEAVSAEFEDLDELRNVVRNCDRLFPEKLESIHPAIAARQLRKRFVSLRRENEKKKLSAELELKLRAIYYDVVDPTAVEGIIRSIYEGDWSKERKLELEDIQFLIKNAPRIFPEDPTTITGPGTRQSVWQLQDKLIAEREAVVHKLCQALASSVYPEREPAQVRELAEEVGKLFERDRFATKKELEEMKKLAADATQHFPPEFSAAIENPSEVTPQL